MKLLPTYDYQNRQTLLQLVAACSHLSPEEKAVLSDAVLNLERKLLESEAQLLQRQEEARAKAVFLEKALSELDQKNKTVEAQNKELQIETALERVRSRAMAMQNSRDIGEAIGLLFTELEKLGIVTLRCGILIIERETKSLEVWTAVSTPEGKVGQAGGRFSMTIHPMLEGAFNAWQQKETMYTYELAGDELVNYFKILLAHNPHYTLSGQSLKVDRQVSSGFFFNEGALFTFTTEPLPDETVVVLKKFATVFGLTYRRYLDLKKAEEQSRQLVRQASIDRLRAEIGSMRSTNDLQRITPLLWQELNALQVSFVRCGVFIVEEAAGIIWAYLSTPQGKSRGVLKMRIDENEHTHLLYSHWREQTVYLDQWEKEQLIAWLAYMSALNKLDGMESYQGEADLPPVLHLHFVPFAQGMLYVGDTAPLASEKILLVKSLAEAFAIAYARYEDFRQLEGAKNKVEATLSELKTTQRQLIQSEKMASLGELTAGIAHEIQNPLNFINNFSEVSTELVSEMEEALQKQDRDEAMALAADLKANLQRIGHHGKRADAIVKGMLLHSRASQGEKLLTDINALADEYLRLSFHGLRAKDSTFQANFTTRLDPAVGTIRVAPQDIGRALLNLFNNAFYAVNEKQKQNRGRFEPLVSLTTQKAGQNIEIAVRDNGTGIPQRMLDKIYQPFFTTKPTGQGTGLGLSLSYDIIKSHGGELKVETKEGEGTVFKIILPANTN